MKRGPVVYGALLIAALLFAYQTWTREETVAPLTGDVVVWSIPPASIKAITLEAQGRSIRVERRSNASGAYLWGTDTRKIEKYRRPKNQSDAPPGQSDERPKAESSTREFMLSEKGDALFANMAELRALRAVGKIDEEKRTLYDLQEKTENISVIYDGGTRNLIVGGKVFGGSDRYALDPSTNEAYVIAQSVVRDLANGEAGLGLAKIHEYAEEEVGKVVIAVKGQQRTLLKIPVTEANGRQSMTWADAQAPDKPDQTMANFLGNIDALRPSRFTGDADVSKLELVLRAEYQTRVGAPLGWIELYRQPPAAGDAPGEPTAPGQPGAAPAGAPGAPGQQGAPGAAPGQQGAPGAAPGQQAAPGQSPKPAREARAAYLMRTEVAHVLAFVPPNVATRIVEDVDQIFGQ